MSVPLFVAGIVSMLAYSARESYEDLDQNVPPVTWTTLVLQWIALAVVAYIAYTTPGRARTLALVAVPLLIASTLVSEFAASPVFAMVLDLLGFAALGVAVGFGTTQSLGIGIAGAALMHFALWVMLPYEDEQRVIRGPGMAFLPIAWMLFAVALMQSSAIAISPQSIISLNKF